MKTNLRVALILLGVTPLLSAQRAQPPVAEAAAPRIGASGVQQRTFCIRFVGRQLTSGSPLLSDLCNHLTPNLGSLEYSATQKTLIATDTVEALDALAAAIAKVDVEKGQVHLDIKIVRISDPESGARALAGSGQSCQEGVAVLDEQQVRTALLRLKQENAGITQAPNNTTIDNQAVAIFIGKKRGPQLLPDGGVATLLDPDTIDILVTPRIQPGTDRILLNTQMRTLFTSHDGAVWSQRVLVSSCQTAVLQKFATPNLGVMVFVTASRPESSDPREAKPAR